MAKPDVVEDEFELQLRQEELARLAKEDGETLSRGISYVDDDGTVMEWDHERRAYFPKIDADFIAQYQISYGTNSFQSDSQGSELTEEEKQAQYQQYWNSYVQTLSQQQPALPTWDVEGNVVEDKKKEEGDEVSGKGSKSKSKTQGAADSEKVAESDEQQAGESGSQHIGDPTSEEHYQYNLYYYGQEYADAYREYYREHPEAEAMPDFIAERALRQGNAKDEEKKKGKDKKGEKKSESGEKRKQPQSEPTWFEVDSSNTTQVYVHGLPTDISNDEFQELMSKCGLIMFDPHTHLPKLKLYKDQEGELKGDGLCTYIKPESVQLALEILDGTEVRGHKITVERAKFEMKGQFDPKKKKKKLSNKAKQKLKEKQQKLFDWRPDKNPYQRAKHERIVILKNMFDIKEFETNPALINELRADVRQECETFGDVTKVVLYDRNPEGVISVTYKEAETADKCVAALNQRWFGGRCVQAGKHDGKTKYDIEETEEEKKKRLEQWENFLSGGGSKEGSGSGADASEKSKDLTTVKDNNGGGVDS